MGSALTPVVLNRLNAVYTKTVQIFFSIFCPTIILDKIVKVTKIHAFGNANEKATQIQKSWWGQR